MIPDAMNSALRSWQHRLPNLFLHKHQKEESNLLYRGRLARLIGGSKTLTILVLSYFTLPLCQKVFSAERASAVTQPKELFLKLSARETFTF